MSAVSFPLPKMVMHLRPRPCVPIHNWHQWAFVSLLVCVMETLFVHKEIFWFLPVFPVLWGVLYLKLFLLNVCATFFCNCIVDGLKVSPFSSSPHVEQRFQPLSFVSQQFLARRGGENLSGVTPHVCSRVLYDAIERTKSINQQHWAKEAKNSVRRRRDLFCFPSLISSPKLKSI